ncbi:hypothetical protein pb186bvf_013904 [Paramecium bursaria]
MKIFIENIVAAYKKKPKFDERRNSKWLLNFSYPKCQIHPDELLSLVCLEQQCKNMLFCCLCEHNGHNFKPLKVLLCEYEQEINEKSKQQPKPLDKNALIQRVMQEKNRQIQSLANLKQVLQNKIDLLTIQTEEFFLSLVNQIQNREEFNQDLQQYIDQISGSVGDPKLLQDSVKDLISNVRLDQQSDDQLSNEDAQKQLDLVMKEIDLNLQLLESAIFQQTDQKLEEMKKKKNTNIFVKITKFIFQPEFKHAQIDIKSSTIVKSQTQSSGYKFAVLTPQLSDSMITQFGFKILNVNSSNWVAVGICQLKVVESKQYGFQFSALGHGAYLVSSNGGSWSSSTQAQNNVVKAFKFGKGDQINCQYNPQAHQIMFSKTKIAQSYKIEVPKDIQGIHPCVLFYYANDEVEFVPPEKFK